MRLELSSPLTLSHEIALSPNLAGKFGADDLRRIGETVWRGYEQDLSSRHRWHERTRAAMELALQIKPGKTFPWPNASNVAFPLLTIAALQFHSRSYPSLFSGPNLVKYSIPGPDSDGSAANQATLISRYMTYQVLDEDESFEEQHDRLLIHVPIVGCGFVKTRYSARDGHNVSEFVPAEDLVIDYYAKSVETALRKTQHITLYRNDVWERCIAGTFLDILGEPWYEGAAPAAPPKQASRDQVAGRQPPHETPADSLLFLEQHCWLDLDQDGYAEPYIVTIERNSHSVVRIVARWETHDAVEYAGARILRIRQTEYFTKYELIPSPDGGIYGIGFGALVGPLNESVDTLVNQLIDAGTLANTAGGFFARGVKIRGGVQTFNPFGWNPVDATGDDLRKGIFPLPVREPAGVLFNLLTLLINYTQRISGSTDIMTGENPGQNTPAYNMQSMVEQGAKIYSAIFKRLWRAMKGEFRKLFILNGFHLGERVPFGDSYVGRQLFLQPVSRLMPAADPEMISEGQRLQQAVTLKQAAMGTPGYNLQEVERRFLRTLRVDDLERIFPGPDKVPPLPNPAAAKEQIKTQREQMKIEAAREQFVIGMMEEQRLNNAKIINLEAQAAKMMAEVEAGERAHELAVVEAKIEMLRSHNDAINQRLELMLRNSKGGENG